jgi:hypothetical protein
VNGTIADHGMLVEVILVAISGFDVNFGAILWSSTRYSLCQLSLLLLILVDRLVELEIHISHLYDVFPTRSDYLVSSEPYCIRECIMILNEVAKELLLASGCMRVFLDRWDLSQVTKAGVDFIDEIWCYDSLIHSILGCFGYHRRCIIHIPATRVLPAALSNQSWLECALLLLFLQKVLTQLFLMAFVFLSLL